MYWGGRLPNFPEKIPIKTSAAPLAREYKYISGKDLHRKD